MGLLLLKMFTFFTDVSFGYVFSPAVVLIIMVALDYFADNIWRSVFCQSAAFGALFVWAVVLLSLSTDSLFLAPQQYNRWLLVLVPILSSLVIIPLARKLDN